MPEEDQEFLRRLHEAFRVEAAEHVQTMSAGLGELEAEPGPARTQHLVASIYREVHSLKGASRSVEARQVEALCQALEDVFAHWKSRAETPAPDALGILHRAVDLIPSLLSPATGSGAASKELVRQLAVLRDSSRQPAAPASGGPKAEAGHHGPRSLPHSADTLPPPAETAGLRELRSPEIPLPQPPVEPRSGGETVRISTVKLDSVLVQAEEMLAAKLTAARRAEDLNGLKSELVQMRNDWRAVEPALRAAIKRGTGDADAERLEAFVDTNSKRLKSIETRIQALVRLSGRDRRQLASMIDNLLEDAKRLVLLPSGTLLEGFPRMVRELARSEGKDVQFVMRGHEVEIDKRILDEIKDPLTHVLRNCVNHGVELPGERGGKPGRAAVELSVVQTGGNEVTITVADDGRGIDVDEVKRAAVKHGKLTAEEARRLTEDEARNLVFRSDVSTSGVITEISGRGLGLSIAREKVQKLGGKISVQSELGHGTSFRLLLPVTLATLRAVFVSVNGREFALPVLQMDRVIAVHTHEVRPIEGRDTIALDQRVVPLVSLEDTLDLPPGNDRGGPGVRRFPCVVLGSVEQRVAFRVDEIGVEQEILVKPLPMPLSRVRNVAGATVHADGRPIPLLHVPDLLKSAAKISEAARNHGHSPEPERDAVKPPILVAEDSITSRMLLKRILEAVGYPVTTAVDGAEALATLRVGDFGLVISDVDMPRLDGFGLTAAIRSDSRLSSIPVVLVTARETPEDRERGIDAGANAYIVKSSFDQSDLLKVIRRLV